MMEIVLHPNENLRKLSSDIVHFDSFLKMFVDQMIDTMFSSGGVGLAAPQVGVNRRVIIVDPSGGDDAKQMIVMINPKILSTSDVYVSIKEGCLSIPDRSAFVSRHSSIKVEFYSLDGVKHELEASGFLGVIIQHEIDHLQGILFTDRASNIITTQRKTLKKTA